VATALQPRIILHSTHAVFFGTDHGLLAICLHANGANVIAGDRAARPLGVARENARLYLRHAREESFSAATAPATEEGAPRVRRYTGLLDAAAGSRELPLQGIGDGIGEGDFVDAANFRRLECRLGDGLAVLEPGEVDTVCIAGVGEYFFKQATCNDLYERLRAQIGIVELWCHRGQGGIFQTRIVFGQHACPSGSKNELFLVSVWQRIVRYACV